MTKKSSILAQKPASLDAMYALIGEDLKQVNAQIIERVKDEIPLINDVVNHIVSSGGKRIRPALTLICSKLCNYNEKRHIPLAAAVEFIHTATLLHDDVVDESKLRRGLPTANEVFGNKASVLVGDFLLSQAFQFMVADGSIKILKILSDASAIIAKGEVMQLMSEGEPQTSIDDYLSIITSKTAALFAAACELGAVVSKKNEHETDLRNFGLNIGIAFQLVDDALDYVADEETLGKTVGDDFREGKITLPVILAYAAGTKEEKAFWTRTMGDLEQTHDDLDKAIILIEKHNAISKTITMAESYCEKSRQCLVNFQPSLARTALYDLIDFCVSRAY